MFIFIPVDFVVRMMLMMVIRNTHNSNDTLEDDDMSKRTFRQVFDDDLLSSCFVVVVDDDDDSTNCCFRRLICSDWIIFGLGFRLGWLMNRSAMIDDGWLWLAALVACVSKIEGSPLDRPIKLYVSDPEPYMHTVPVELLEEQPTRLRGRIFSTETVAY
jgi:hypothetical protein